MVTLGSLLITMHINAEKVECGLKDFTSNLQGKLKVLGVPPKLLKPGSCLYNAYILGPVSEW